MSAKLKKEPLSLLVFFTALAFIFGILIPPVRGFYLIAVFLIFLLTTGKKGPLLFCFFLLGSFYQQAATPQFQLPDYQEEITVSGKVVEEDRNVVAVDDLSEKIIIYDDSIDLNYGMRVTVTGQPVAPSPEFKDYFHKDLISVSFFSPQLEITEKPTGIMSAVYSFRRRASAKMEEGLPFPESEILKAVLLGDRSKIPDSLQEKFSAVGVAHLLAVSGTHIVIISAIIFSLLTVLKVKYKYLLTVLSLTAFVLLVGATPSAVRAAIMGSLIFISDFTERKSGFRILIYTALIMLLFNPRLVTDIGFQLSFSATGGILLFSKKMTRLIDKNNFIVDLLAITLSAQIFTLPLIFIYFENIPFLAPISNIFLAPLLPLMMSIGIVSAALSFLFPPTVAFLPVFFIIRVVLIFVRMFYTIYPL